MLALAVCMAMSFVACGDDDDDSPGAQRRNALIGTWYRSEQSSGTRGTFWEEYTFAPSQGYYNNSNGVTADFTYNTETEGLINYDITWRYAVGSYRKDKYYWRYRIDGNVLYLENKKYTRKQ